MKSVGVIKVAKRRENDEYVLRANNKTKAVWHVINKEVGKLWKYDKKIELNDGTQYQIHRMWQVW
jgi:hypothetical protein